MAEIEGPPPGSSTVLLFYSFVRSRAAAVTAMMPVFDERRVRPARTPPSLSLALSTPFRRQISAPLLSPVVVPGRWVVLLLMLLIRRPVRAVRRLLLVVVLRLGVVLVVAAAAAAAGVSARRPEDADRCGLGRLLHHHRRRRRGFFCSLDSLLLWLLMPILLSSSQASVSHHGRRRRTSSATHRIVGCCCFVAAAMFCLCAVCRLFLRDDTRCFFSSF